MIIIIMAFALQNNAPLQSNVVQPAQNSQTSSPSQANSDTAPPIDNIENKTEDDAGNNEEFDALFDVDAPFDDTLDLGVDWPDAPENSDGLKTADNDANKIDKDGINAISKDQANIIETEAVIAENQNIIIENQNIVINDDGDEEEVQLSDSARQDALRFVDDGIEIADQNQNQTPSVRINSEGVKNYRILFSGIENIDSERILSRFNMLSALRLDSNEAANGSQILRRAKTDTILMAQLLRLEGYYDNLVDYRIEDFNINNAPIDQEAVDIDVIIDATPGVRYRFGAIDLPGLAASEDEIFLREALSLKIGDPVQQDAILTGQTNLQERLLNNGYPFGKVGEPDILIDHNRQEGDLTLPVTPDRKYQFGRIITPPDSVLSAKHLQKIARFDEGEIYRQSAVTDLRQAIFATSLASNVLVTPVPSEQNPDQVDLNVALDAAPPRTVSGLAGFNTGEGFRVEASWEHRNFFPPQGALNIAGVLGTREQAAGITFRRSNFRGRDRVLTAAFRASNQNLDAFDARTIDIGIGYERQTTLIFQKKWTYNVGLEYALSDERAAFDNVISRELFNILALPAGLSFDGSDNLLDPTKGFRLSARISPEISTGVDNIAYFKSQIDGSFYQPANDKLVLAGRIRLASITGAPTSSIAPSRRNFAGGGGSVRGFGFQDIGPEDINGNPTGGRGLAEFAIEARYRIGSFGIVPFLDAGGVSNNSTPDFTDLRFAAGIGVRYYTSFGPVRIDVGTPFNRREGESLIAVAISLGQAF